MRTLNGDVWKRRGLSLLWGPEALAELAKPEEVASIRDVFHVSRSWPDELPSNGGKTLVVAGVEGCLDSLVPEDAESWIESDLRPRLVGFQEEYEGRAAWVLWLPTGRRRILMNRANETYLWKCGAPYGDRQIGAEYYGEAPKTMLAV